MTLLDFPERVACTVFLGGCDFRCPFCHNFELVDGTASPIMDEGELFEFLKKRQGLLDGVAITGGEPCIQKELPEFIGRIRELGFAIKLDTEGYHPDMLRRLYDESALDYVAMDIKNSPEKYASTVGVEIVDMDVIRESINIIMSSGVPYEFRTTVVSAFHEENDFHGIGELIRGAGRYFIQPFTDRETVPSGGLAAPSDEELEKYRQIMAAYVEKAEIRGA